MNSFRLAFRQTTGSGRLVWLIYGITLVLALLVALPFYSTLQVEDQNSLAFLTLLNGFDYTVYADFMHRSERTISPLMRVGRWLGILYVFLSIFFAGGILAQFAQASTTVSPVNINLFWQGCSQYVRRFLGLFGVTSLFVLIGAGLWLVIGSLLGIILTDMLTERGLFWIGALFFTLAAFTATFLLCIGDYAKVIAFREQETNPFRTFGRAGRLVLHNPGQTYGLYILLILIGGGLFVLYFLIDDAVLMSGWITIALMLIIQQALILARVGLKVWSLGITYAVYETLPKPAPVRQPELRTKSLPNESSASEPDASEPESPID